MSYKDDRKYSGDASIQFWNRVNQIPYRQGGEALYALGCELQSLEERVLARLAELERKRQTEKAA